MRALRFTEFGDLGVLRVENVPEPVPTATAAIVRVEAASVNPSDVKNVAGGMDWTTLPRTPGRDFAGIVVSGPPEWEGAAVWGTGGDTGFSRDGSHAESPRRACDPTRDLPAIGDQNLREHRRIICRLGALRESIRFDR